MEAAFRSQFPGGDKTAFQLLANVYWNPKFPKIVNLKEILKLTIKTMCHVAVGQYFEFFLSEANTALILQVHFLYDAHIVTVTQPLRGWSGLQ